MILRLHLGGLALAVEAHGPCAWPADLLAYRAPPGTHPPPDLHLQLHAEPGWRNPRLPITLKQTAGPGPAPALSSPLGEVLNAAGTLDHHRLDLAFSAPGPDRYHAHCDGSDGALEAAVQLALVASLLPRAGLLVHASAGVDPGGGAWLIPGPSGAGKSTAARGAGFARILADELVVVRGTAAGFAVWPTPFWSLGRRAPLSYTPAPLAVLARPVKAAAPTLAPLARGEAAAWLLGCVAWYAATGRVAAFDLACDVARAAPRCVALSFPKEGPWLTAVHRPS